MARRRLRELAVGARKPGAAAAGHAGFAPGTLWQSALPVLAAPVDPPRADNPASGDPVCAGLKLFHDADPACSVFSWSQVLRPGRQPSLRLAFFDFSGGFASLVADLSGEAIAAIGPTRRVEVALRLRVSRPLTCFLRLNVLAGDAHEVLHETVVLDTGDRQVAFDLGGVRVPFDRRISAWVDMILHAPRMCQVDIETLRISLRDADGAA